MNSRLSVKSQAYTIFFFTLKYYLEKKLVMKVFINALLNLLQVRKYCNKINFIAAVPPQQRSQILGYRPEHFWVTLPLFADALEFSPLQNLNKLHFWPIMKNDLPLPSSSFSVTLFTHNNFTFLSTHRRFSLSSVVS